MIRTLKLRLLQLAGRSPLASLVLHSEWRRRRLPVFCYHGISLEDEHEWAPAFYMSQAVFRERMQSLEKLGIRVLPFGEAIARLYAGELPPRSVALTFDDGFYDFHRLALPVLREFGFPVTVYLTTLYCEYNRPPFGPMCSYLLWKSRGRALDWPGVLESPLSLDSSGRAMAAKRIFQFADDKAPSPQQRDGVLGELAERLGIDYAGLCRRRILHVMNPAEVRGLAGIEQVDVQLHTHSHNVSRDRQVFREEVLVNQRKIGEMGGFKEHWHLCYPSGVYLPEFPGWLTELGVESATTCNLGLASRRSHRMLLPRILDAANLSTCEFEAWATGMAAVLPRRAMLGWRRRAAQADRL